MEYTTNYHLPKWVESDRILMGDFNEAMDGIDQGIASAQDTAEAAQSAAEAAHAAAENAQSAADAAQSTADNAYCPENKPYVIGSYRGTAAQQRIILGFKPTLIIISRTYSSNNVEDSYGTCAIVSGSGEADSVLIMEDGFVLLSTNSSRYPAINWNNYFYYYIAFR